MFLKVAWRCNSFGVIDVSKWRPTTIGGESLEEINCVRSSRTDLFFCCIRRERPLCFAILFAWFLVRARLIELVILLFFLLRRRALFSETLEVRRSLS